MDGSLEPVPHSLPLLNGLIAEMPNCANSLRVVRRAWLGGVSPLTYNLQFTIYNLQFAIYELVRK